MCLCTCQTVAAILQLGYCSLVEATAVLLFAAVMSFQVCLCKLCSSTQGNNPVDGHVLVAGGGVELASRPCRWQTLTDAERLHPLPEQRSWLAIRNVVFEDYDMIFLYIILIYRMQTKECVSDCFPVCKANMLNVVTEHSKKLSTQGLTLLLLKPLTLQ